MAFNSFTQPKSMKTTLSVKTLQPCFVENKIKPTLLALGSRYYDICHCFKLSFQIYCNLNREAGLVGVFQLSVFWMETYFWLWYNPNFQCCCENPLVSGSQVQILICKLHCIYFILILKLFHFLNWILWDEITSFKSLFSHLRSEQMEQPSPFHWDP